MDNPTFASRWNVDEIDARYTQWIENPASLEAEWQYFFEGFHLGIDGNGVAPPVSTATTSVTGDPSKNVEKHARLYGAIYAFRSIGHTQASFNPLKEVIEENPRLSMERLGF
ncbi:MAG: hypothetical protein VCA18_12015, partial [Opitutales bacterium]